MRSDRLRALNVPQRVTVELDGSGLPASVGARGSGLGAREVEAVGEQWRIDDEWWRQPIARRYVEVILEGGGRAVLFQDLVTGDWWMQTP